MPHAAVEDLLARTIGLDPASLGATLLEQALGRRMRALGLAGPEAYARLVHESAGELQELVEELVVPETWFFRDRQPFVLLRQQATAWLAGPARARESAVFRALSVPCATGEEPYSIAMTLLDAGLPRQGFAVDAIDISARALERARRGVYTARSVRAVDATLRDRYFRPHPDGLELAGPVRDSVAFHHGNLLDADLLRSHPGYDVIFCRNVLIYLNASARKRAVATLDRLLLPAGLLFVGHAEQSALMDSHFRSVASRGSFAYRKPEAPPGASPAPAAPTGGARPAAKRAGRPSPARPDHGQPHSSGARCSSPPEPPAVAGRARAGHAGSPPDAADWLGQATRLADTHQFDRAAELCEEAIRRRGPSAAACHLLGMIRQASGDLEQAERWLSKAVYLDGRHEESLLALALLARRRGDLAAEAGYQRRARRVRRRNSAP